MGTCFIQHRELNSVICDDLELWDGNGVRGKFKNICIHIADSLCCTEETNTTL